MRFGKDILTDVVSFFSLSLWDIMNINYTNNYCAIVFYFIIFLVLVKRTPSVLLFYE